VIELATRTLYRIPHLGALLRTGRGRLIVLVVASQLLIPLHYYVANRDPHDERFAWRMFSPMRMAACTPEMKVDDKRVELAAEFHEAWIEMVKRGRLGVIEAMGARMCQKHPGSSVTIRFQCRYLDREPVLYGGFDLCHAPRI
jgi:hypothetical protein